MKLLYSYLTFFLFAFTFAQQISQPVGSALQVRDNSSSDNSQVDIEVDQYLKQLVAALGLPQSGNLTKRDAPDNPALTAAFTALNQSGTGVQIVHGLATNSATQGSTISLVEQYIKTTGLTKILSAADQSGLAVSIVMRFFINYSLVPDLWKIIVALWNSGIISLNKRALGDLIGGLVGGVISGINNVLTGVQQSILSSVISIINTVTDLTTICSSLNKSGLAVSVLEDLITTTDGQSFLVKFITQAVNDGVITFGILIDALKGSGIVTDTFSTIIGNSTYRKIIFIWAVKNLVSLIQYIF
ncbi:hypothetical protein G210_5879 [Candida maltosa Xu316]|uniref:Uncharacterized protein n=1 Tax=Candida maltosa (strain Xu316) TaxID=1245528 RepID=M3K3N5_CANMX|nr:hypothetical protein G210_5879 [Candida maltosa Xu316]